MQTTAACSREDGREGSSPLTTRNSLFAKADRGRGRETAKCHSSVSCPRTFWICWSHAQIVRLAGAVGTLQSGIRIYLSAQKAPGKADETAHVLPVTRVEVRKRGGSAGSSSGMFAAPDFASDCNEIVMMEGSEAVKSNAQLTTWAAL
jgi:hypothetical protein